MSYSMKLKSAMEQIKEILEENNIAGFVVLHTPGFSEYLNHITPSYSCAKIEGSNIIFQAKASELGKERSHQMQADTYNLFTHFADIIESHGYAYAETKNYLKNQLGGEDGDSTHTSIQQQQN